MPNRDNSNYIETMVQSVKSIEDKIQFTSKNSITRKKHFNRFKKITNFFLPILISNIIILTSMTTCGWLSFFKRNDTQKHANIMKTIEFTQEDSNTTIHKNIESFKNIKNHIEYDSGWYFNEETNLFERTVDIYMLDTNDIDENSEKEYLQNDIIDRLRHVDRNIYRTPNLTEEDKKHTASTTTLTYLGIDDEDYTVVKENFFVFVGRHSLYYAIIVAILLLTNKIRKFRLRDELEKISNTYKKEIAEFENFNQKKLVLEIRKNNLRRLDYE